MTGPEVYRAISRVTNELSAHGISKRHTSQHDSFAYRSIDDLLNGLAPALAKHKLCVLPRTLERQAIELTGTSGERLANVVVRVAFDLVSARDASRHTIEAYGEAYDSSDKGTAKAATAAFKTAIFQAFCIPVGNVDDPDAASPRVSVAARKHQPPPEIGWEAWVNDLVKIASSCESEEALRRLQQTYRETLSGLSRERRDLYEAAGATFSARSAALASSAPPLREPTHRREDAPLQDEDLVNA